MSRFRFGPFEVDTDTAQLRRDGAALDVQPLTVELTAILAERAGQVVDRATLSGLLWPDVAVTEHSLSQALYRMRRTLGDHANLVVTVPGRGVRLDTVVTTVGPVAIGPGSQVEALLERVHERPIRLVGPPGAGIAGLRSALVDRAGPDAWSDGDDAEVVAVGGLALPDGWTATDVARSEAGAAFVRLTRRWLPGFELDDRSASGVRELCCTLDGLPEWLAFAAARLRLMPLERLVARLPEELPAWTHPDRVHPPHQGSVASAVAHALDGLGSAERGAVRDLAVFAGPVDVSVAVEVLGRPLPAGLRLGVDLRETEGRVAVWAGMREVLRSEVPTPIRERHARWALVSGEGDELAAAHVSDPVLAAEVARALVRARLREGGTLPATCVEPEAWVLRHRRGAALPAELPDRPWAWSLRMRDDVRRGRSERALACCARLAAEASRSGDETEASRLQGFAEGLRCAISGEEPPPVALPHAVARAAALGDAAGLARRREPLLAALATAVHAPHPALATTLRGFGALLAEAAVRAVVAVRGPAGGRALGSAAARDVGLVALADAVEEGDARSAEERAARLLRWVLGAEAGVDLAGGR